MTVTYTFSLPEEQEELTVWQAGPGAQRVLRVVAQELRQIRKYGEKYPEAVREMADRIEQLMYDAAAAEGVEVWS